MLGAKQKKGNPAAVVTFILVMLVILGVILASAFGSAKQIDHGSLPPEPETTEPEEEFEYIDIAGADVNMGLLILVNSSHGYTHEETNLVFINDLKNDVYGLYSIELKAKSEVILKMNEMLADFNKATEIDTVLVRDAYRTYEEQTELYNGKDHAFVAMPGHSEHESGLAIDFGIQKGSFDGTGDLAWFPENSFRYGFIQRYTDVKKAITKIDAEPWHYRYIGEPHAFYITQQNLCYEEYIDLLDRYMFLGEHLFIEGHDGKQYEIYKSPVDPTEPTTQLPVPRGKKYTVSGDNVNSFIVTIELEDDAPRKNP